MTADQQAIAKQLKIANQIEVLKAGGSFLDEQNAAAAKTAETARRMAERNVLRQAIREGLEL